MELNAYFNQATNSVLVGLADAVAPDGHKLLCTITHGTPGKETTAPELNLGDTIYARVYEELNKQFEIFDRLSFRIDFIGDFTLIDDFVAEAEPKDGKIVITMGVRPANGTHDGFYVVADDPHLVNIDSPEAGVFEVAFNGADSTILRAGVANSTLEKSFPIVLPQ